MIYSVTLQTDVRPGRCYTVDMMRLWVGALAVVLSLPVQAGAENDDVTVLVVRHRWHTGIAFPADRLSPALGFLEPHFNEPQFYEFGWGDDAFYRQDDSLPGIGFHSAWLCSL